MAERLLAKEKGRPARMRDPSLHFRSLIVMFYVYILKSEKDGKFYIGSTKNIEQRLYRHNKGLVKSTKNRTPFVLVYYERFLTLSEARRRERKIKSYKGGKAFDNLMKSTRR